MQERQVSQTSKNAFYLEDKENNPYNDENVNFNGQYVQNSLMKQVQDNMLTSRKIKQIDNFSQNLMRQPFGQLNNNQNNKIIDNPSHFQKGKITKEFQNTTQNENMYEDKYQQKNVQQYQNIYLQKSPYFPCDFDVYDDISNQLSLQRAQLSNCLIISDIKKNIQEVPEYAQEIIEYQKQKLKNFKFFDYMKRQNQINETMRYIVTNWMIHVHESFLYTPETLYKSIDILDGFLGKVKFPRSRLQLLGVTALFMAGKIDEIYPESLQKYCELTNNTYKKEEILYMEGEILRVMNFNFSQPSQIFFLDKFLQICDFIDEKESMLARCVLELGLLEYHFLRYNPCIKAAAAILYVIFIFHRQYVDKWNVMQIYQECGFCSVEQLKHLVKLYSILLINGIEKIRKQDGECRVILKYQSQQFLQVTKIPVVNLKL